jgi:uncharacterized membrane protein YidH (DUF202 family)
MTNQAENDRTLRTLVQLAEEENVLTSSLIRLAEKRTQYAKVRTDSAGERTGLARQQAKLSDQTTQLAERRTELSVTRTDLSQDRTDLAEARTNKAQLRTIMSSYRSILAQERTELAVVRTGVALVALGVALTRIFGFGYWTIFDAFLILAGAVVSIYSARKYILTQRIGNDYQRKLEPVFHSFISETSGESDQDI